MLKIIGLILASIVFCMIISELLVRWVAPQKLIVLNPSIWRPDTTFGWRHQEDTNTTVNTGEGLVHFVTDQNGWRINHDQSGRMPQQPEIAILTIGDSFLAGLQVENENTIPMVLRRNLRVRHNKEVAVYNASVGGWDPNHYLLEVKNALKKKRFDLGLVFLFVGNDCVRYKSQSYPPKQVASYELTLPTRFHWDEFVNSILYPINEYLERKSHFYVLVKSRSQMILARFGLTAYYFPDIFKVSDRRSNRWQNTVEIYKSIDEEFRKYDVPAIFVLLPATYQVSQEIFYDYVKGFRIDPDSVDLEQPNRLLEQAFESAGLTLLDPLPLMRQKAGAGLEMHGRVDTHTSMRLAIALSLNT